MDILKVKLKTNLRNCKTLERSCLSDVEAVRVDEPDSVVFLPDLEIGSTLGSLRSVEMVGASFIGKVLAATSVDFFSDDLGCGNTVLHVGLEVLLDPSTS